MKKLKLPSVDLYSQDIFPKVGTSTEIIPTEIALHMTSRQNYTSLFLRNVVSCLTNDITLFKRV